MNLLKVVSTKKFAVCLGMLATFAAILVFRNVFADSGPVISNANPQGTVTASSVKITLDTEDLARCKYSTSDSSYGSMSNKLDTPDGLSHTAAIGSLSKGSYTYYVRCQDFEGNANNSSTEIKFTVGTISCLGDNCSSVTTTANGPALSNLLPTATTYNGYAVLSVTTNVAADCRYSWYDKSYDAMTLPFSTTNKLYHTASATLANPGYYTYYVRCKDSAGNVNQVAGRIAFRYASTVTTTYVAPKTTTATVVKTPVDSTPPVVSALMPSGEVSTKKVEISCVTDETAHCKYGTADADFDALTDKFEVPGSIVSLDPGGTSHTKTVTLDKPGEYTYYVRCKDGKDNKNTVSGKIDFNYTLPAGPKISDMQPSGGVVNQSSVTFTLTTDKTATCRYSKEDIGYDRMGDSFDTSDGMLHLATVDLPDYGPYVYYVRCADSEGNQNSNSEVLNFEYQNPNPEENATENMPGETATTAAPIACENIQNGDKDGVCAKVLDCICDPDCDEALGDADPDCANVAKPSANNGWIAAVFIGLILLIIVVIVIIIIKRRGNQEEDVELP